MAFASASARPGRRAVQLLHAGPFGSSGISSGNELSGCVAQCVRTFSSTAAVLAAPPPKKKAAGPRKKSSVKGIAKTGGGGPINVMRDINVDQQFVASTEEKTPIDTYAASSARNESVGKVFKVSEKFVKAVGTLPKSMQSTAISQKTAQVPTLVFRKSTLNLIQEVNRQVEEPEASRKTVLVGPSGVGKSALLLQTADHYAQNGWIVVYFPNTLDWIDATTPFVRNGDAWDQPVLAASLLQQIKRVNQRQLANINITGSYKIGQKTVEKITLDKLVDMGQGRDRNVAPAVLEAFFTELYSSETSRPPVLFAVDAVNGLFRETEYRDTESRRLRPNQLSVLKPILGLFTRKTRPPKSAVIGSMDSTETGTLSPFLEQKMNLRDAPLNRVADLAVILPEKAAPAHLSGLSASKTYRSMGAPTPWPVFPYDREEVEAAVKLYSESSLLRDTLEPQDVRIGKFLALSGGNPLKVFKLAALQRSPGRPAPRTGHGTKATL